MHEPIILIVVGSSLAVVASRIRKWRSAAAVQNRLKD